VFERGGDDVAVVRFGHALAALEVTIERHVLEEVGVFTLASDMLVDAALVAGGVDDVASGDLVPGAVGVLVRNAAYPLGILKHTGDGAVLTDVDAASPSVVEQDRVEFLPLDLVGVRRGAAELGGNREGEPPGFWVLPPAQGAAALYHEAGAGEFIGHAEHGHGKVGESMREYVV